MEAGDGQPRQVPALKRANEIAIDRPIQRKRTHSQILDDRAIELIEPKVIKREKFNSTEVRQKFDFKDLLKISDYADIYRGVFDKIKNLFQRALKHAKPKDFCFVKLYDSTSDKEVCERFCVGDSVEDLISNMLEKLVQSNSEMKVESKMEMVVQIVENLSGGGGQHRRLSTLRKNEVIRKKLRHLFVPPVTDNNVCFSISLAFLLNPSLPMDEAKKVGKQLHQSVGKSENERVALSDIVKFEQVTKSKIVVFWRTLDGHQHYSSETEPCPEKTYYLYLHEGHYYGIKNIKGFLGMSYVCIFCHKGYNRQNGHKCEHTCNVCLHPKCQKGRTVKCQDCLRICRSKSCYQQHKVVTKRQKGNFSWCDLTKYCPECNREYTITQPNAKKKKTQHKCLTKKCDHCRKPLTKNHQCFIQPEQVQEPSEKLIFYDFETTQENGFHEANYVCAMDYGGECWTSHGESCVADFFDHFRQEKYRGYTFIAHNARGFDAYLLIKYLVEELITPKLIVQGSKVMCFEDKHFSQRYIDSLNFLPMKLSVLPSALGFDQEKKGHFPHFFNTTKNQNYRGPYPEPHYYGADSFMPKEREEFFEWYNSVKNGVFDFRKEIAEYCKNDVVILKEACLRFRKELIATVEVDPFRSVTIAGMCMAIYRSRFLTKDTIALTYPNCYIQPQKAHSKESLEWLEYVSATEGIHIQHALNAGEHKVGDHMVDGFSSSSKGCVGFEFLGCYHHACLTCYKPEEMHQTRKIKCKDVNKECLQKLENLKRNDNFTLRSIWEHDWINQKKNDSKVKEFMSKYKAPERLNPREALYGGRTNALCLYYKTQENEKIHYYDFTSLYPFVNKTKVYPTGHPTIIFDDFQSVEKYFGLIRAKVFPPHGLFHPVLPYRAAGKLMFPLCRTCCETESKQMDCQHSDDERALTGVWTSVEMVKAMEKGYKVARLFEVWHFEKRSETLFSEYVNTFLKGKQEASGYPESIETDAEKERYIQDYEEHEKIKLNQDNIKVNKAKRSLCKLALNSLWGKFAQRANPSNSTLISEPKQFIDYVFSPKYDVSNLMFLNDDVALVQWKYKDDSSSRNTNENIFIAAFTTAYARLELYDVMDKLQERALYHDTDSVIFVSGPKDWVPETGDFLGQLTNELSQGDHIVEYVSGGPKLYGYRTVQNKICMKVKGITLNHTNQQSVSLKSLTDLVENYVDKNPSEIPTTANQITRVKKGFHLKNKVVNKQLRVVYNKRVLCENGRTLPYGY
ncbi:uncharacterized protein LOC121684091 isoform X2 [Alosa sapidissima]|uniref:uncharacterized protein LOC121684091 isoform X2 n=1 Tax=Alosa sapidissima TaxID=34773 RepID=UPI001C087E3D|nr:uncharacterized protein LOC121684091 isoform X2 [Alosa sapidissima]